MIRTLPLYPQADDLVGRGTWVTALTSSLTKHKRCALPAAVVTFTCQSDFRCVTQKLRRAAAGERLKASCPQCQIRYGQNPAFNVCLSPKLPGPVIFTEGKVEQ